MTNLTCLIQNSVAYAKSCIWFLTQASSWSLRKLIVCIFQISPFVSVYKSGLKSQANNQSSATFHWLEKNQKKRKKNVEGGDNFDSGACLLFLLRSSEPRFHGKQSLHTWKCSGITHLSVFFDYPMQSLKPGFIHLSTKKNLLTFLPNNC